MVDRIRVYQASSSEIFGEPRETPQTETTPLSPVTPYGVAKAYGHFIIASTAAATGCTQAAGSSTTTSRRAGRSTSFPARSHGQPRRSRSGWRTRSRSGPRSAAGLGLCRRLRARDVADGAARRSGRLRRRHGSHALRPRPRRVCLRTSASTGGTCPQRPALSSAARRSCTISSAIRRRRATGLAGRRRSASRSSSGCSWMPSSRRCQVSPARRRPRRGRAPSRPR